MTGETLKVQCCIAGGGPAGMMLGLLLARAGVDVVVLENTAIFSRTSAVTQFTPLHPRSAARAWAARRVFEAAAPESARTRRVYRRPGDSFRRLHSSPDPLQVYCFHTAVGLSEFPRAAGSTLSVDHEIANYSASNNCAAHKTSL
jgi:2-polyprenyl-6-methoxyphenol hydroxylase-like FAD-dependent oxidoreductase